MDSKQTINRLTAMIIIMTGASIGLVWTDPDGLHATVMGYVLVAILCLCVAWFSIWTRSYFRQITKTKDCREDSNEPARQ